MLSASSGVLRSFLPAACRYDADRFISDTASRLDLASAAGEVLPREILKLFRGRTVMLALPRQIETAAALIQLDGVARRIVLMPQDVAASEIPAIADAAGVERIMSVWPTTVQGQGATIDRGAVCLPDMAGGSATEWVLLTSGTTGRPKLVVHTLQTLAGHIRPVGRSAAGPVWCTFYDIRRYGGLQIFLRAIVGGGSLVLSDPAEAPGAFLRRAAAEGATHFLGTPSHWRRAHMTDAAASITPAYVRLSGELADQIILDRLRAAYPRAAIVHAFASTEAGLAFEVADGKAGVPAELLDRPGGFAEIRIRDDALQIRSDRNAIGYLNHRVTPIAGADGFIDTGDLVALRGDRYHFAGRRDGVVNVGGQKVQPEEVEAVINQHPDVQMSLVKARRNAVTGSLVVADVVCRPWQAPPGVAQSDIARTLQLDIREFCRRRLPPHKVPAAINIVTSLDIAPSGKLVRLNA
jgi:acyl-CoA synthetase (AMP-forming)/AMP-acid ligase II